MKIFLINTVVLNGGDAAIMMAIKRAVSARLPQPADWVVSDSQPTVARGLYPEESFFGEAYPTVMDSVRSKTGLSKRIARKLMVWLLPLLTLRPLWSIRWLSRFLPADYCQLVKAYETADVIISTGGTYLVENYRLEPRLFGFDLVRGLKKPLVLYTQSLGPFDNAYYRRKLRTVFNYASVILLRDEESRKSVIDLGTDPAKCHVCADSVFGLYKGIPSKTTRYSQSPAIAISVRSWSFFRTRSNEEGMKRYTEAIAHATEHVVRKYGANVTFISSCQGIPSYWTDDSALAVKIHSDCLPKDIQSRVLVDRQFYSPDRMVAKLSEFDFALTTRMHMAIMAMVGGVPALPVSYEFKTRELFNNIGLGKWVEEIETVSGESLCQKLDEFWAEISSVRAQIHRELPSLRESALQAADLTLQVIREAV